jgi:hypothetical protein
VFVYSPIEETRIEALRLCHVDRTRLHETERSNWVSRWLTDKRSPFCAR